MIFAGYPFAVIVADQRLYPLGDTCHGHDDDGADIGDDGVAYDEFLVQICQDRMVEQEDNDSGGEFRDAGG